MSTIQISKIQVRRGQELQTGMPRLDAGEFGWAEDTEHLYIGKRIVDGAADDENTRILTENDISNIFSIFLGTHSVASTSTYKYRDGITYIASTITSIATKLDNWVSLTDYGLTDTNTATDITVQLTAAIQNLYANQGPADWNSWQTADARRQLIIPAGNFYISNEIDLPPYTSLIGQGPDLTTLTLLSNSSMFKTVDALGNNFENGNMQSGGAEAKLITLKGMTFQFTTDPTSDQSLISLDNVKDVLIENCRFTTSGTTGAAVYGSGVSVRGTGGGIESGDANLCENVRFSNCQFENLNIAVSVTGTVVRPVIENSIFQNLYNGVYISPGTPANLLGPTNAFISSNRFKRIINEAIFVGTSTNRTTHVSKENFFIEVGNGIVLDDYTTGPTASVISFFSGGNKSVDDYFHRRTVGNNASITSNFYFNPLITGSVQIVDSATYTTSTNFSTNNQICKIPVNKQDQLIAIQYQMYSTGYSRKGNLLINIAGSDGTSSISDNFNYSFDPVLFTDAGPSDPLFSVGPSNNSSYVLLACDDSSRDSHAGGYFTIEFQTNIIY